MQRRKFLYSTALLGAGLLTGCRTAAPDTQPAAAAVGGDWFDISLAQWSLHRSFFSKALDPLDFAGITRNTYGLGGVEYVNQFFRDRARDQAYLGRLKQRADDHGVRSLLIMVDGEGNLGDRDTAARKTAVENHHPWVDVAHYLGCHSIRVNAAGQGSREELAAAATEGLAQLAEYAAQEGLNVLVENHGGYSSDGSWLAGVIAGTGMDNCGTLPDFGNFCIERTADGCAEAYDPYRGVQEMMPYAKAVSAKTYNFTAAGQEVDIDYRRMLGLVKAAGYRGWMGIEYEGDSMTEDAGIRATIELLRKVRPTV